MMASQDLVVLPGSSLILNDLMRDEFGSMISPWIVRRKLKLSFALVPCVLATLSGF